MGTDKVYTYPISLGKNIGERPAHKVCLDEFLLDTHETTQKEWQDVMGFNPTAFPGEDLPVEHISWEEARSYCHKRQARLPTEAEWEYAARAGSDQENFWGDGVNGDYAWFDRNSGRRPHPVGTRKPNPWGLYDMMGSVWEWVYDWLDLNYYKYSPVKNPRGPEDRRSNHVIRGGSWLDDETFFRAALRNRGLGDQTETFVVGVRCAKTPERKAVKTTGSP